MQARNGSGISRMDGKFPKTAGARRIDILRSHRCTPGSGPLSSEGHDSIQILDLRRVLPFPFSVDQPIGSVRAGCPVKGSRSRLSRRTRPLSRSSPKPRTLRPRDADCDQAGGKAAQSRLRRDRTHRQHRNRCPAEEWRRADHHAAYGTRRAAGGGENRPSLCEQGARERRRWP